MDGLTPMVIFLCGILPLVISTMTEEGLVDRYGTLFGVTPESHWRQTGVVILYHDVTRGGVLYELEMDFPDSGQADIQVWRQADGDNIDNGYRNFNLRQQWPVVYTGAGSRLVVQLNETKEGCLTVLTGDRLGVYHSSRREEFSISIRNTTGLSVWGSNIWLPASTNLTVGTVMGFRNLHYPIEFSLVYRVLSDEEFLPTPGPSTSTTARLTQTTTPLTTSTPATSTVIPGVPMSTKATTTSYQPIISTSEGNKDVGVTATGTRETEIPTATDALEAPVPIYVIGVAVGVSVLIVTAILGALLWRYRRCHGKSYRETTNPIYNSTNNSRGIPMDSMRESTYDSIPGSAVATIRERDRDVTDPPTWAASFPYPI